MYCIVLELNLSQLDHSRKHRIRLLVVLVCEFLAARNAGDGTAVPLDCHGVHFHAQSEHVQAGAMFNEQAFSYICSVHGDFSGIAVDRGVIVSFDQFASEVDVESTVFLGENSCLR